MALEIITPTAAEVIPQPPVNDNHIKESLEFMREGLNVPDRGEVLRMIQDQILNFNVLNKIIFRKPDGTETKLEEVPRHYLFPEILETIDADIPTALIGPAGSGKSTVLEQVAKALEKKFYLQNSVQGAHELTGYMDAYGKYQTSTFRQAFEFGGLLFVDEVDTSDPGALKWLNTAIANGYAMFPDKTDPVMRHRDFRIAIAANTFGNGADRIYVGANQLDASTLDRFIFFDFRYDNKLETLVSGNAVWAERVQAIRDAAIKERARVVISPRASINGAKMLARGWDQKKVEDRVIWKGMDPEMKERILKALPVKGETAKISDDNWGRSKKKKAA